MTGLPRFTALLEEGMAAGLHAGAQAHVSVHGEPVAGVAVGEARPGVAMAAGTLVPWFSCTKAATAVAVARAWEVHGFSLDDRVADYVPELVAGSADAVTVRHLLTHTSGLPHLGDDDDGPGPAGDEALGALARAELPEGWVPGRRAAYSPRTGFLALGEMVRRLDGRPFDRYVREEVFEPLGMDDCWLALDPARHAAYGDRVAVVHDAAPRGGRLRPRFDLAAPDALARCSPGSSGVGPAAQLARLLEMLALGGERDGTRLLVPQTVEAMTARHRVGLVDETFRVRLDWGLGLMIDSSHYGTVPHPYGYGAHASPRTFGHGGRQAAIAFADPEHGLVAAVMTSGRPGEVANTRRYHALLTALYEDLGLA